jgi:serine/threonine-protein phosphatase 4 regulatory subunit 2
VTVPLSQMPSSPLLHDISESFEWSLEYDSILERIANTDVIDIEWSKLRDIIKFKVDKNVAMFLAESRPSPPMPHPITSHPLAVGGLKLPPFPTRKRVDINANEPPVNFMNERQANDLKNIIYDQLHEFDDNPPFTIQRVCELCLNPKQHYKSIGKYLRAVEKSLLVTSTWDAFPPLTAKELEGPSRAAIALGSAPSTAPATPLFSPISFLHDDARRSTSRSPPPSPLALGATIIKLEEGEPKALGLVDELDDPSPGHMSDHPTPLSSVTTIRSRPSIGSLEQRFVKEEGEAGNKGHDSESGGDMVLDDADDKENKA